MEEREEATLMRSSLGALGQNFQLRGSKKNKTPQRGSLQP